MAQLIKFSEDMGMSNIFRSLKVRDVESRKLVEIFGTPILRRALAITVLFDPSASQCV